MSVLNRKMFNRGARKELRKKGGIEDVQYFQTAGPVTVSVAGGVPTGVATSGRPPPGVGLRGLGFNPSDPSAEEDLPSSFSSSLKDLDGFIFFKIKSLISSPDRVS